MMLLVFVGAAGAGRAARSADGCASTRARWPAPRGRLRGGGRWRASAAPRHAGVLGFLLPAALLVRAWVADGAGRPAAGRTGSFNTCCLAGSAAAVVLPVALVAAYAARVASAACCAAAVTLASGGYALPGVVLGVGLLTVAGAIDRCALAADLAGRRQRRRGRLRLCGALFLGRLPGRRVGAGAHQPVDGPQRAQPRPAPLDLLREVHWPLMRRSLALGRAAGRRSTA